MEGPSLVSDETMIPRFGTSDIELDVPVEIVPPTFRGRLQSECHVECRQPMRFRGLPDQTHTGLLRGAASLPVIATEACSNNVVPALLAACRHGNDMIKSQILGWELLSAVLTRVIIAGIDVCA